MVSAYDIKKDTILKIIKENEVIGKSPMPISIINTKTGISYRVIRNIVEELGYVVTKEEYNLSRVTTVVKRKRDD